MISLHRLQMNQLRLAYLSLEYPIGHVRPLLLPMLDREDQSEEVRGPRDGAVANFPSGNPDPGAILPFDTARPVNDSAEGIRPRQPGRLPL
jgi:hypothetical protein